MPYELCTECGCVTGGGLTCICDSPEYHVEQQDDEFDGFDNEEGFVLYIPLIWLAFLAAIALVMAPTLVDIVHALLHAKNVLGA